MHISPESAPLRSGRRSTVREKTSGQMLAKPRPQQAMPASASGREPRNKNARPARPSSAETRKKRRAPMKLRTAEPRRRPAARAMKKRPGAGGGGEGPGDKAQPP